MKPLTVGKVQSDDWLALIKINDSQWRSIFETLAVQKQIPLTIDELTEVFPKAIDERTRSRLASHAVGLRRLADQKEKGVGTVVSALEEGLRKKGWDDGEMSLFAGIRDNVIKLIENDSIEQITKFTELYYQHSHHVHDMRIVSTMTPVFDASREQIVAITTKNTLFLTYSDKWENQTSLELALGIEDIEALKTQATNALEKTKKIDAIVKNKLGLQNKIYT